MSLLDTDTICAVATPAGRSGVGIVRISGPLSSSICKTILGKVPKPRYANYSEFRDKNGLVLDKGIALFFPAPNSFTGEDVLELQGHGGNYVLNSILKTCLLAGARVARPGEFSERSFLNEKIDLVQAEAIADLIDANSEQAASSAVRSLTGRFSFHIDELISKITKIRVNVEAAIDFSDEDIDFISDTRVIDSLHCVLQTLETIFQQAKQGALLKEGMRAVIAGKPNAGKSSLLNALSGQDSAIVTDIPGTTRDVVAVQIDIDGMPVHIADTAGLRRSEDKVEQEGIKRARNAMEQADRVLLVVDSSASEQAVDKLLEDLGLLSGNVIPTTGDDVLTKKITLVYNKIDVVDNAIAKETTINIDDTLSFPAIYLSAKTGSGLNELKSHLKNCIGFTATEEGSFIARRRHLQALEQAHRLLKSAELQLNNNMSVELVAEDLRLAHRELGSITGEFSSDDLLGEIFSSFCIGK